MSTPIFRLHGASSRSTTRYSREARRVSHMRVTPPVSPERPGSRPAFAQQPTPGRANKRFQRRGERRERIDFCRELCPSPLGEVVCTVADDVTERVADLGRRSEHVLSHSGGLERDRATTRGMRLSDDLGRCVTPGACGRRRTDNRRCVLVQLSSTGVRARCARWQALWDTPVRPSQSRNTSAVPGGRRRISRWTGSCVREGFHDGWVGRGGNDVRRTMCTSLTRWFGSAANPA